jgi:hypothetical protein
MNIIKMLFATILMVILFGPIIYGARKEFIELSDPDIVDRRADFKRIRIIIEVLVLLYVACNVWLVLVQESTGYFQSEF